MAMRVRNLGTAVAITFGLAAGCAGAMDYSTAPATPAAPSPPAAPMEDSCGSVAGEFGQTSGGVALGGADDTMAWQVADQSDDGLRTFLDRLKAENARIDHIQAAYDRVTECRKAQVRAIKAEVAANRLPRDLAAAHLAAIHRLYRTDLLVARLTGQVVTLRAERFREAARRPATAAPLPKRLQTEIAEQTATNQAKRGAFVASIERAEQWRDTGFVLG